MATSLKRLQQWQNEELDEIQNMSNDDSDENVENGPSNEPSSSKTPKSIRTKMTSENVTRKRCFPKDLSEEESWDDFGTTSDESPCSRPLSFERLKKPTKTRMALKDAPTESVSTPSTKSTPVMTKTKRTKVSAQSDSTPPIIVSARVLLEEEKKRARGNIAKANQLLQSGL